MTSAFKTPGLAAESLESRALLAVTATLVGADLQITLGAADDVAYLSNDGANYIVRGTGLSGYAAALATVNAVAVAGTAETNQSFSVTPGVAAVLVDPLTVAASVESTTIAGSVDTTGAVLVDSPAITLAANVTTTGQQRYKGAVGLVGERTLSSGAGDVAFASTVDSSPVVIVDPDAFASGTDLTTAYAGITLSAVGTSDAGVVVKAGQSLVSTPTTGDYAPTGNLVIAGRLSDSAWNATEGVFKASFAAPVTSVSLDFAANDDFDPNAYIDAYDASGTKVASATYAPTIPELSFVTLTVSAPGIAYVLASFDPSGIHTGLLDNLRATYSVTPAAALTVTSALTTTFSGIVGGVAPLASLTTDGLGTTLVAGGAITTLNDQVFKNAYVLKADATLTTKTAGAITFKSTVDGGYSLTANTSGTTTFGDSVGATTPLTSLATDTGGTVSLQSVTTTGSQTYRDDTVTLNGTYKTTDSAFTVDKVTKLAGNTIVSTGKGPIDFKGTVDGAYSLEANSTGVTTFGDSVGATTPLTSLATDTGGTTEIGTYAAGDVAVKTTAVAGQVYGDAVTLKKNTTLTATNGTIDFKQSLNGAQTLTVADATDVYFRGKVGGITPLAGLLLQKASTVTSGDSISLDGTPNLATNGITIESGVNNVSFTKDGSQIRNFSANGILFSGGSTGSTIGGFIISANGGDGVRLDAGSYAGTAISKNSIDDNDGNGVRLTAATGPISISANLINANGLNGVYADTSTAVSISGNAIAANQGHGVGVEGGNGGIGGNDIEANGGNGILLAGGYNVLDNTITANSLNGIEVVTGLANLAITFNEITANLLDGIIFNAGGVTGFDVSLNDIHANKSDGIQADAGSYAGTVLRDNNVYQNIAEGMFLNAASVAGGAITGLTIGGTRADDGNSIHHNGSNPSSPDDPRSGIRVSAGDYTGTSILGNDVASNSRHGIHLDAQVAGITNLLIGAAQDGDPQLGNWIDANGRNGILVGSDLGTVSSYQGTVIGNNDITRNGVNGIKFASKGVTSLDVVQNFVGTRGSDNSFDGGNLSHGIRVNAGDYSSTGIRQNYVAYNNVDGLRLAPPSTPSIGTVTNLAVSANTFTQNDSDGIQASSGFYGGTVITGNTVIDNKSDGVYLAGSFPSLGGIINLSLTGNTIRGNTDGVQADAGTYTGTVIHANTLSGNVNGIHLAPGGGSLTNLMIGGDKTASPSPSNTISSNFSNGIVADAGTYTGTVIQGNDIRSNAAEGLFLSAGGGTNVLANLLIGGSNSATVGNTVVLNGANGIRTSDGDLRGTTIAANFIANNFINGLLVRGKNLMIGWTDDAGDPNVVANTITRNGQYGIELRGPGAKDVTALSNSIYLNGVIGPDAKAGKGIVRTNGGNPDVEAPVILRVVDDASSNVIRVAYAVPSSGTYYVQFFDNTPTDERGIFPFNTAGFEGRTLVGDDPAQASTPVVSGKKPAILGVLVDGGNTLNVAEIPATRVAVGNWITATATKVDGTVPKSTSEFSKGFQRGNAPTLAVGGDGPSTWAAEYPYQVVNQTTITVTSASQGTMAGLIGLKNAFIVLSPADSSSGGSATVSPNVTRKVVSSRWTDEALRTSVTLSLDAGDTLPPTTGSFVIGGVTLPAARIYDTSSFTTLAWSASGPGATQISLAGDQQANFFIGQSVTIPASPSAVARTVGAVQLVGGNTLVTLTQPVDSASGSLTFSNGMLFEVGQQRITAALRAAGLPASQVNAFVNRFQGGLRVAQADLNGDGYNELTTAPGGINAVTLPATIAAGSNVLGMPAFTSIGLSVGMQVAQVSSSNLPAGTTILSISRGPAGDFLTLSNASKNAVTSPAMYSFDVYGYSFGAALRTVTIYDGMTNGDTATSIDVSAEFPGYTGGFLVAMGNVRPENAGSGDAVAELIVASTGKVVVYNVTCPRRGSALAIDPKPVAKSDDTAFTGVRITGLTSGDFLDNGVNPQDARDEVVVSSRTLAPESQIPPPPQQQPEPSTAVRVFTVPIAAVTPGEIQPLERTREFVVQSSVINAPDGKLQNVFYNGAALAAGDIDGLVTVASGKPPALQPELVLGASFMGLGHFRVLANTLVAKGTQSEINAALEQGSGFTRVKPDWAPWPGAGGPTYFVGQNTPAPTAAGANSPLAVAVVDADGRRGPSRDVRGELFAAIGATNQTANVIRRLAWDNTAKYWVANDLGQIQARPRPTDNSTTTKTRFPLGFGLRLG